MQINTFAKYDEIRAVLGVAKQELPDEQLALGLYGEELFQELSVISGVFAPDTEVRDLAGHYSYLKSLDTLTADQQLLLSYIRTFAIYVVATCILDNISLLAPKTISDGKALMTRFSSEATFKYVQDKVLQKKYSVKRKIQDFMGITVTDKTYISVITPAIDIVTNEPYE